MKNEKSMRDLLLLPREQHVMIAKLTADCGQFICLTFLGSDFLEFVRDNKPSDENYSNNFNFYGEVL